jgi:exonuclease-1
VEYGRSKFFANTDSSGSPSRRKNGRKSTDFSLWSDDSIQEALLDLPDPEDLSRNPSPGKQVEILSTAEATTVLEIDKEADEDRISQQTNATTTTSVFSQQQDGSATPPSSVENSQREDFSGLSPFDASLLAEVDDLRAKFSYNSSLQESFVKGSLGLNQSTPVGVATRTSVLKQRALNSNPGKGSINTGSPDSSRLKIQHSVMSTQEESQPKVDIEDSAWQEAGEDIVVLASDAVEPPSPKIHGPPKLQMPMGSEDLLVSESEAEEEAECTTPKVKAAIDLGRFAFIP